MSPSWLKLYFWDAIIFILERDLLEHNAFYSIVPLDNFLNCCFFKERTEDRLIPEVPNQLSKKGAKVKKEGFICTDFLNFSPSKVEG